MCISHILLKAGLRTEQCACVYLVSLEAKLWNMHHPPLLLTERSRAWAYIETVKRLALWLKATYVFFIIILFKGRLNLSIFLMYVRCGMNPISPAMSYMPLKTWTGADMVFILLKWQAVKEQTDVHRLKVCEYIGLVNFNTTTCLISRILRSHSILALISIT